MLLAQTLERIISFGGGVRVDAKKYLAPSLERFAAFAATSGATVIIYNADSLLAPSLERIAAFGKGRVIFEFSE